jgi:hypothetical protein
MKGGRATLIGLIVALFLGQAAIQRTAVFPFWQKHYSPQQAGIVEGLSPDQLLAALAGFREMIAGILWVRADSFFDNGNYDAILPIIRLVTWLDPRQIDVYATGMWHIGYNFTDEQQRSDRRYIPSALALGREGARRNPDTYEMFFETGWMWYHKIDDDPDQAVDWFRKAQERPDMIAARKNLLVNALERAGRVDDALDANFVLLRAAEKRLAESDAFGNRQNRDTIENKLDTQLVRMAQRGWFASKEGRLAQGAYDVNPPFDVGFSARVSVIQPRVLRVEGTWNVTPVGTRIRVILRDMNFPGAVPAGMDWDGQADVQLDPPRDSTFMQDSLFVRNRRFNREIDMSKDPTMYPFNQEEYLVEFYYNPRSAPPHIQDKFGWNGEGMTDSNFLNTEIRPGVRVLYATLRLTRDQLLRRGDWLDRTPVVQTANYRAPDAGQLNEDIIQVPNLRAAEPAR